MLHSPPRIVPPGLKRLLLDFSVSVLIEKPEDLIDYASDYFNSLMENEEFKHELKQEDCAVHSPKILSKTHSVQTVNEHENEIALLFSNKTESFRDLPIFNSIDEDAFNIIISNMQSIETDTCETVISKGNPVDCLYVIESGVFHVLNQEKRGNEQLLAIYRDCGYFGDIALTKNKPMSVTVLSMGRGLLRTVHKTTFDIFLKASILDKRRRYSSLLKRISEFKDLREFERYLICDNLDEWCLTDGEVIVEEKAIESFVFIVESGKVDIHKNLAPHEKKRISSPTGWFSSAHWIGGFLEEPYSYTAKAVGDVKLAILDSTVFCCLPWTEKLEVLQSKLKKCKY